tara:strand:+ start:2377 stop:2592 length:216 start_codon:yes stop_codon:yes gene_type:complete
MPSEQEYMDAIADLNTLLAVRDQRIRELELTVIKANKLIQGADNAGNNEKKDGQGNEKKASRQEKKDEKAS